MRSVNRYHCALLILCGNFRGSISKVHYGFQSGAFPNPDRAPKNDDSFASGLHYDSKNSLLYVTGGTYSRFWDGLRSSGSTRDISPLDKSDCFLTILEIPKEKKTENGGNVDKEMKMVYASRFGKEYTDEACSAVMHMPSVGTNTRAISLGNTEEGGLLTSLRTPGSRKAAKYGFLMDFDMRLTKKQDKVKEVSGKVEGGQLIYDHPVQYPIAVTADPLTSHAKEMFVALFASPIKSQNDVQQDVRPDLTLTDDNAEYGSDFRVVIEMTKSKSQATLDYEAAEIGDFEEGGVQETIVSGWKRSFSPNTGRSEDIPTLSVSDLEYVPRMRNGLADDVLVLTGTTNGHGTEFGGLDPTKNNIDNGYVTKLSPADGEIDPTKDGSVATTRIGGTTAATSIKGICFQKGLVDVEYIYVVGFTKGLLAKSSLKVNELSSNKDNEISKHAFVTKLKLRTLEPVWSRQIGSRNGEDVIGYGCDVSPDGSTVFLAGTIENGGEIRYVEGGMKYDLNSAGGDDIFVASYYTTGPTKFIRQFGTSKDDTVARGKGVVCDKNGDAIVLGNTRGSLMRLRGDHDNDIFVMSIGKNKGRMRAIAEDAPDKYVKGGSINIDSGGEEAGESLFTVEIVAIVVSSAVLFFAIIYVLCSLRKVASDGTNWDSNDRVMNYLDEFNDDEVELHVRHSATGGVHGIYDFEAKNVGKYAPKPNEVLISSEKKNTRRPTNRLSAEESTKVLDTALFIVDSNKAKRSNENNGEFQSDAVGSHDTSLNEPNAHRLGTAVSTSNVTVQASNTSESKSQSDSMAEDFILPDVNENEKEDWDNEII